VQVVVHQLCRRGGISSLLERSRDAQVLSVRQITAAGAGALRVVVLGLVRDLPGHRRARAARLLPAFPLALSALRRPPLPAGRLPPGQVIGARRHRRVPAVPGLRPLGRLKLLARVSDHRFERREPLRLHRELRLLFPDPLRLLLDQRITRTSPAALRHLAEKQPVVIRVVILVEHSQTLPKASSRTRQDT
jgi:hypothetical protein